MSGWENYELYSLDFEFCISDFFKIKNGSKKTFFRRKSFYEKLLTDGAVPLNAPTGNVN